MTLRSDRPRRLARGVTRGWIALSAVAIAIIAPLPYFVLSLEEMASNGTIAANYVDRPHLVQVAFHLHITFGGLALLLSPIQLSSRIRARVPRLHRWAGRITIGAILVAGPAGAVLATTNVAGAIGVVGFGLLAVVWTGCAVAARAAARRRDFVTHRRWAIRTFALTYAAVTLRLWLAVLIPAQVAAGVDETLAFDRAYPLMPFLAWVPNLLLAEWYLRRRPGPGGRSRTLRPSGAVERPR
ncbi:DUF2306 domain-containing protein [Cryptosporangium sp. NPDC051539]|uniref:DUF2306 domain-containing protein n=1 Tax=Cryptosporangium sp. NPDC051539 TaxID=3363962 RepID=UPI0037AD56C9